MHTLAHGIDLVEVSRIGELLDRHGDRFRERVFTLAELTAAEAKSSKSANRIIHLAGRFAAKEAVMKALGTGWGQGVGFTDIEILALPTGVPAVTLQGDALTHAIRQGIQSWLLSISHTDTHATASAIALGIPPTPTA